MVISFREENLCNDKHCEKFLHASLHIYIDTSFFNNSFLKSIQLAMGKTLKYRCPSFPPGADNLVEKTDIA